jgi:hypothetical protein
MGWDTRPDDDGDASCEFACVADENYLYVAVKTRDDAKCVDEDTGRGLFQDDSVEIYVDGDNSKPSEYEPDVCQITIGRYNVGGDPDNPKLSDFRGWNWRGAAPDETGTKAAVVDTGYGWAVEAAIPLAFFGIRPTNGTVIGFNIHLNDDDDWGERDHRLGWSKAELAGDDVAYINPSVFGKLRFVSIDTPTPSETVSEMAKAKPPARAKKATALSKSKIAAMAIIVAGSVIWNLSN